MKQLLILIFLFFLGCSSPPQIEISYNPGSLRFSGKKCFYLQTNFVDQFPNRHSGTRNNYQAALWLRKYMQQLGWDSKIDKWQIINYNQTLTLCNVVCHLPGQSSKQIVVMAHHDQSPLTVEGADNDASGVAILLQLAEIFAAVKRRPYTLVFVFTDAEEYGMLGSLRFVQNHTDHSQIIAGISLDNLGKKWSNGIDIAQLGQFRGFGQLWLAIAARRAVEANEELWVPQIRPAWMQMLNQAVPASFMDQGPMIAAGIPALGFATLYKPGSEKDVWDTYHTPLDLMRYQSPKILEQSGRICEALLQQLLAMKKFPRESGPYLYFTSSNQVFRGFFLWLVFAIIVISFFGLSYLSVQPESFTVMLHQWRRALPLFFSIWLPLVISFSFLYLFVAIGIMDKYHLYPATAKDPALFSPHWLAVILFLLILSLSAWGGQKLLPYNSDIKTTSLGFFIIGIAALYLLFKNPFSLLFFIPLWLWYFVGNRSGKARVFDYTMFLAGGIFVYVLIYFFGFLILRNNWAILWYLLMMFSIKMIGFFTMLVITAVLASGIMMVRKT